MKKITFKEYYESKEQLLKASNNLPKIINEYIIKKYCKIPVLTQENKKDYVPLKPKDVIKILWEFQDVKNPQVKHITINETTYLPCWNNEKIKNWIDSTTLVKGK